jgi:tryptophan-rich sensory protein
MMLLAFIDIVLLDIFIYLNIYAFGILYPLAGYLLIPYAIWVTFAYYLNFANWWINRNVPEEGNGNYMEHI